MASFRSLKKNTSPNGQGVGVGGGGGVALGCNDNVFPKKKEKRMCQKHPMVRGFVSLSLHIGGLDSVSRPPRIVRASRQGICHII